MDEKEAKRITKEFGFPVVTLSAETAKKCEVSHAFGFLAGLASERERSERLQADLETARARAEKLVVVLSRYHDKFESHYIGCDDKEERCEGCLAIEHFNSLEGESPLGAQSGGALNAGSSVCDTKESSLPNDRQATNKEGENG